MNSLGPVRAADLLEAWERGRQATPLDRALLLLATAQPDCSREELATLTIGARDAGLLRLHARLFGARLECVACCPACGESLEAALSVEDLSLPAGVARGQAPRQVEAEGYHIRHRLPTSADLVAAHARVAAAGNGAEAAAAARAVLLERCIAVVTGPNGVAADPTALPEGVVGAVADSMAAADPLADPELDLTCPACTARWMAPLDIVAFLWTEIDAWALRTLREVHALARAYGWGEAAILALTPERRRAYLELVGP